MPNAPLTNAEKAKFRVQCPKPGQEACCVSSNNCSPLSQGEVIMPCAMRKIAVSNNARRKSLTEIWEQVCGTYQGPSGGKKTRRSKNRRTKNRKSRRNSLW